MRARIGTPVGRHIGAAQFQSALKSFHCGEIFIQRLYVVELMRRAISILGIVLVLLGAAMYALLIQLRSETFRADLPPWMDLALAIVGLGTVLSFAGLFLAKRETRMISVLRASRYLGYATVLNTIAAACFSIPVLVPTFEFPILITRWPGVYMVIAYAFFVMIGVLGTFAWSAFYRWMPEFMSKESVYMPLFVFQFFAMEVGIYLMSVFMFLGGYVGSALAYSGVGDAVVGASMEFAVIPSALGIFLLSMSALVGVTNTLLSKRIY